MPTQSPLFDGARDRRSQPSEPVLQEVVGRPSLHTVDRCFFVDRTGHHDERDVQVAFLEQLQRVGRVERRQMVVSQYDVDVGSQIGEKVALALD